jgi:aminoglycoside phosphotransferase (APT) family kinase protein
LGRGGPGVAPARDPHLDRARFAGDLGEFLHELRTVPVHDGPTAGRHCSCRGCHPSVYTDQAQKALIALANQVDADACKAMWRAALRSAWSTEPVWFHGDVAVGNLLNAVRSTLRSHRLRDVWDRGSGL